MKSSRHALSLIPALLLAACGGMPEEQAGQETPGAQGSLEQGVDRLPPVFSTAWFVNGCRYALWYEQEADTYYGHGAQYVFVTRERSSGCAYQRTDLGVSYNASLDPQADMRMAAGQGQLVVYFRETGLMNSYRYARFFHIAPSSLSVVRQDTLFTLVNSGGQISIGDIRVAALRITSTGDFLAQGSKTGYFPDRPGDTATTQFTATYPQYFTSAQEPTIRTY
jgi:hypothetical protein